MMIETRKIPATDDHGVMVRATTSNGHSATGHYNYAAGPMEAHREVAERLIGDYVYLMYTTDQGYMFRTEGS